jgi:hypothetical protein
MCTSYLVAVGKIYPLPDCLLVPFCEGFVLVAYLKFELLLWTRNFCI